MDDDGVQTGWLPQDSEGVGGRLAADAIRGSRIDPASAFLRLGGAGGLGVLAVVSASGGSWVGASLAAFAGAAVVAFIGPSRRRGIRDLARIASVPEEQPTAMRCDRNGVVDPDARRWSDAA